MASIVTIDKDLHKFNMIENYIYLYHTNTWIIIPTYPESITDSMNVDFSSTTPLARSAPIYSFRSSGPRSIQVALSLHRDLMNQVNYKNSNVNLQLDDDYVDTLVNEIQAIALPEYRASSKMVDPPLIAIRFGNDIYCKGVVTGSVSVTKSLPILRNNKYSVVGINFNVSEVDPYDASTVMKMGSLRGLNTTLERNLWKMSNTTGSVVAGSGLKYNVVM